MPRRPDRRVYRAEFRDRIVTTCGLEAVIKGKFVVEVLRCSNGHVWSASITDGNQELTICYAPTAAKAKTRARGYFGAALTDWAVGELVDGQWRPVDEARERELKGVA